MKRILILILGLFGVAQAQFAPTSAKTAFKNGVSLGTRDSSAYVAADSLVVVINRQGRMMYRSTDGYWKVLANAAASDYVPYTGAVTNVNLGNFRLSARSLRMDSIYANGSGGAVAVTNSGTRSFGWGAGGSSEVTFYGFAGYNANRSSTYTARSFTDKNYVDSSLALRLLVGDTSTMLSNYRRKTTLIENADLRNSAITINGSSTSLGGSVSVGTVTSVAASAGTGISVTGSPITSSGTLTITNTAPDQTVTLTAGSGISVTGTYPNFTVANTSPSSGGTVTSVSAGTGMSFTTITSSGAVNADTTVLATRAYAAGLDVAKANTSLNNVNGVLSSTYGGAGSVSGILKANGSGVVSAAVNNTDYTLLNGTGFVRMSGTTPSYVTGASSQFVKADGSLDGTSYATAVAGGYLPLSGGTLTGALNGTSATFTSNYLLNNGTASKKGYTYQSPASNWGQQVSGLYFTPNNAVDAATTFTIDLWDGVGSIITPLIISPAGQINGTYNFASSATNDSEPAVGTSTAENKKYNYIGQGGYWGIKTIGTSKAFAIDTYNSNAPKNVLTITQTGAATFSSSVTASSFVKSGGTSAQYLMADGSVTTASSGTSGTYTPTITGVSNVASSTSNQAQYMRVGNVVTVSGYIEVDPTSGSTPTEFRISLPVATSWSMGTSKAGGVMAGIDGYAVGTIYADPATDTVTFRYTSSSTGSNMGISFTFTYLIE